MRTLKSLTRFLRELVAFAGENKMWWLVPLVLVLALASALVLMSPAALPMVYTLF